MESPFPGKILNQSQFLIKKARFCNKKFWTLLGNVFKLHGSPPHSPPNPAPPPPPPKLGTDYRCKEIILTVLTGLKKSLSTLLGTSTSGSWKKWCTIMILTIRTHSLRWMDELGFYIPFNSIAVISWRWKGEHERLYAMKCRLGLERISPPAGFEPARPWSRVGSAKRSVTQTFRQPQV